MMNALTVKTLTQDTARCFPGESTQGSIFVAGEEGGIIVGPIVFLQQRIDQNQE